MNSRGLVARMWHVGGTALANLFLLNILLIVVCIPIVTMPPAIVAVFSVVRGWSEAHDERVFAVFFGAFKQHFWRSYALCLPVVVASGVFATEFSVFSHRHDIMSVLMLALSCGVALLFVTMAVHLLPIEVSGNWPLRRVYELSIFLGIRSMGTTMLRVFPGLFLFMFVTVWMPPLLVFGVVPAMVWFLYASSRNVLRKVGYEGADANSF